MGIRNGYDEGIFCWVELATSDAPAAKQFYNTLLGWQFQDFPMETGDIYAMAHKGERPVAALYPLMPDMLELNIPPHWQSYINVKDVDTTTQRWQAQGGTVIRPPFDVEGYGRMAIVKDPTDAVVSLWQAGSHIGARVVNEVNTFCWAELQTRGVEKAAEFYKSVLGWEIETEDKPPFYTTAKVNGHMNCGMFDMDKVNLPPEIPSTWAVYFNVENLDQSLEIVKSEGGRALIEPVAIDVGRFVSIADPQGAVLTIMELKYVDD
ncbi:MAG: VOC family protein [Cyanobacteria bacterium J06632_22]